VSATKVAGVAMKQILWNLGLLLGQSTGTTVALLAAVANCICLRELLAGLPISDLRAANNALHPIN
jgi:hypothetical protein